MSGKQNRSNANNLRVLALAGVMIAGMSTLVIYSPTLYRMFCNATGFGGTVRRAAAPQTPASGETVTVHFDANVSSDLPWEFRPVQSKVKTHFGESTRINYFARNNSDETIVARATFNVTPYKAAPYFFKIQCFCFTDEKLGPHQSAELPVVFYVDDELLKDRNANEVRDITLSYTFFKQNDISTEEVAGTRDLKAGSQRTDAELKKAKSVAFDNDAPRR